MNYSIILTWKPIGLTPKECLDYIKANNDLPLIDCLNVGYKIAYAGRLDPMACGILPIIIAPQNSIHNICSSLQNSKKIYRFSMISGIRTDTYDILGIINERNVQFNPLSEDMIKSQKYPVYSSKTIKDPKSGKMRKLFEFAKEGRIKEIEDLDLIPSHDIEVHYIKEISRTLKEGGEILNDIFESINSLSTISSTKSFRVKDIKDSWIKRGITKTLSYEYITFEASVSSGTYIRGLVNEMGGTAIHINRISIDKYENNINLPLLDIDITKRKDPWIINKNIYTT